MQIIDFEKIGNVVRFYLGNNGEQWGDDWDDAPYDFNAGAVYDQYVQGTKDIAFPPEWMFWNRATEILTTMSRKRK